MTLKKFDHTDNWNNEEYFNYMKESGDWFPHDELGHTGKPCDRCGQDVLSSWRVDALRCVEGKYIVAREFEICLLCTMELCATTTSDGYETVGIDSVNVSQETR